MYVALTLYYTSTPSLINGEPEKATLRSLQTSLAAKYPDETWKPLPPHLFLFFLFHYVVVGLNLLLRFQHRNNIHTIGLDGQELAFVVLELLSFSLAFNNLPELILALYN